MVNKRFRKGRCLPVPKSRIMILFLEGWIEYSEGPFSSGGSEDRTTQLAGGRGSATGYENDYISQARITVSCTSRSSSGVTESGFFNRTASSSSAKSSTKRR